MGIYAIAFTEKGMELGQHLASATDGEIKLHRCQDGELIKWTGEHFIPGGAIVFIGAVGIAVRAVAPFLKQKSTDPSVVVIDEACRFVVPILSGHMGGANALAKGLADFLGATAVITTATDVSNVFTVDTWATSIGLKIANPDKIKHVSSKLLNTGSATFSSIYPVSGELPQGLKQLPDGADCDFSISYLSGIPENTLHLVLPVLTLGIGCKKNTPFEAIERAFTEFMNTCGCHKLAVCQVCSIDLKSSEPGILEFCSAHNFPVNFFSAYQLSQAIGDFSSSAFVEESTGVDNVCERAAALGSSGTLLVRKSVFDGITMALAVREPKPEVADPNE